MVIKLPKKINIEASKMSSNSNSEIRQKISLIENKIEDLVFPVNPKLVIQLYSKLLTNYEQSEIQE